MEFIEHKTSHKNKDAIKKSGHFGPLIGGILGVVPQCGFSAAASSLYSARIITLGTLIAVFLSTSDEMLPILISEAVDVRIILSIFLGYSPQRGSGYGFRNGMERMDCFKNTIRRRIYAVRRRQS